MSFVDEKDDIVEGLTELETYDHAKKATDRIDDKEPDDMYLLAAIIDDDDLFF